MMSVHFLVSWDLVPTLLILIKIYLQLVGKDM